MYEAVHAGDEAALRRMTYSVDLFNECLEIMYGHDMASQVAVLRGVAAMCGGSLPVHFFDEHDYMLTWRFESPEAVRVFTQLSDPVTVEHGLFNALWQLQGYRGRSDHEKRVVDACLNNLVTAYYVERALRALQANACPSRLARQYETRAARAVHAAVTEELVLEVSAHDTACGAVLAARLGAVTESFLPRLRGALTDARCLWRLGTYPQAVGLPGVPPVRTREDELRITAENIYLAHSAEFNDEEILYAATHGVDFRRVDSAALTNEQVALLMRHGHAVPVNMLPHIRPPPGFRQPLAYADYIAAAHEYDCVAEAFQYAAFPIDPDIVASIHSLAKLYHEEPIPEEELQILQQAARWLPVQAVPGLPPREWDDERAAVRAAVYPYLPAVLEALVGRFV